MTHHLWNFLLVVSCWCSVSDFLIRDAKPVLGCGDSFRCPWLRPAWRVLEYSDSVVKEAPQPSKRLEEEERLIFLKPFLFLFLSCFSSSIKGNGKDRRRKGGREEKRGTVKSSISNDGSFQNPGVRFSSAKEPDAKQDFSAPSIFEVSTITMQFCLSKTLKAAWAWDGSYCWYLHQRLGICSLLEAQAGPLSLPWLSSPVALGHSPVTPASVGGAGREGTRISVSSMHVRVINF